MSTIARQPVAPASLPAHTPESHRRPWGGFDIFALNRSASVKLITVAPGGRLSLQVHHLRAETWVVLDPGLEVVVGDRTWVAAVDEVIHVPRQVLHRMTATLGRVRVLEVVLDHFDEADILRLEDAYGRA
jgi:mannose-6-phosphate isomerase-like protein (cupin superfamily)